MFPQPPERENSVLVKCNAASKKPLATNYSGTESLWLVQHPVNQYDQDWRSPTHPEGPSPIQRGRGGEGDHQQTPHPPARTRHHPNRRLTNYHHPPHWQQHPPPPSNCHRFGPVGMAANPPPTQRKERPLPTKRALPQPLTHHPLPSPTRA